MKNEQPLVSIVCDVYNHEPYLTDCLEGFLNQKTNFDFEILINDDASTDNSSKIIKEYYERYPDIIKPIFQKDNQYSKGVKIWGDIQFPRANGKYVAVCEGDDFWIDPYKLQKQVDLLESNESLIGVVTDTSIVDNNGNVICKKRGNVVPNNKQGQYSFRDFFGNGENHHRYPTATVIFRNNHKEEVLSKMNHTRNAYLSDWTLWIILMTFGDFYYLDQVTAAYRINPTSVTHTADRIGRARASFEICRKVADIIPEQYSDIAEDLRNTDCHIMPLAHAYRKEHKYFHALWYTMVSLIKSPSLTFGWFRNYFVRTNK